MTNSLVIRKGTNLSKRSKALRAAQYVRMSTDYQRYSIQNQAAVIAAFAQQNNLSIVRTYTDEGRSGLRIRGRPGLIELIDDVSSGVADFDHILVYDVSRWGRFQDVDESAHYEFVCKQNGVRVSYCAEQFSNDGSLLSSIVKNIKRVMAAEFSRELSVKVHAGQSRIASLGYRVGGPLAFGLRRELVGEDQKPKGWLEKGDRKSLQTDRVRLRPGSQNEAETVRWIFHQFVVEQLSDAEIARGLNGAKVANQNGRPWTASMIHCILRNEGYVGNIVYNRTSRRLGQKLVDNPSDRWIRSNSVLEPIVDKGLFARAQNIMEQRYLSLPEEQMLQRLRLLLKRKGELNSNIIANASGVPCVSSYFKHFGSLRKAFALVGYIPPRNCDWIDTKRCWFEILATHAKQIAEALKSTKRVPVHLEEENACVIVKGSGRICFQIARHSPRRKPNHLAEWRAHRKKGLSGLLVVLRLDEANRGIADYLVLPASKITSAYLRFSDKNVHDAIAFNTMPELIAGIKSRLRRKARDGYAA
jgi:DNA invertase Pin-like site-specific DNA recombinase